MIMFFQNAEKESTANFVHANSLCSCKLIHIICSAGPRSDRSDRGQKDSPVHGPPVS